MHTFRVHCVGLMGGVDLEEKCAIFQSLLAYQLGGCSVPRILELHRIVVAIFPVLSVPRVEPQDQVVMTMAPPILAGLITSTDILGSESTRWVISGIVEQPPELTCMGQITVQQYNWTGVSVVLMLG